jgi:hypothetical protein
VHGDSGWNDRGEGQPHAQRHFQRGVSAASVAEERPAVYLQAQTRVRQNQHSSKTYPPFTLIRGVQLTP